MNANVSWPYVLTFPRLSEPHNSKLSDWKPSHIQARVLGDGKRWGGGQSPYVSVKINNALHIQALTCI